MLRFWCFSKLRFGRLTSQGFIGLCMRRKTTNFGVGLRKTPSEHSPFRKIKIGEIRHPHRWIGGAVPGTHRIHGTGIFTYIWLMLMVYVGKYTIHGSYGVSDDWPVCINYIPGVFFSYPSGWLGDFYSWTSSLFWWQMSHKTTSLFGLWYTDTDLRVTILSCRGFYYPGRESSPPLPQFS